MIPAVLFPRVSGTSQEDGYSLNAQTERLVGYAERHSFRIDRVFRIVESSTRGDRRQFQGAIASVRSMRGPILILADLIDRVQRSFKRSTLLDEPLLTVRRVILEMNSKRRSAF